MSSNGAEENNMESSHHANNESVQSILQQQNVTPLMRPPGLPKPNQEMKYFSWKVKKCSSEVNIEKMTFHDNSRPQNGE